MPSLAPRVLEPEPPPEEAVLCMRECVASAADGERRCAEAVEGLREPAPIAAEGAASVDPKARVRADAAVVELAPTRAEAGVPVLDSSDVPAAPEMDPRGARAEVGRVFFTTAPGAAAEAADEDAAAEGAAPAAEEAAVAGRVLMVPVALSDATVAFGRLFFFSPEAASPELDRAVTAPPLPWPGFLPIAADPTATPGGLSFEPAAAPVDERAVEEPVGVEAGADIWLGCLADTSELDSAAFEARACCSCRTTVTASRDHGGQREDTNCTSEAPRAAPWRSL